MTLHVTVDPTRCQGHGKCLDDSPQVFDMDDDGYAFVVLVDPPENLAEGVYRAETACPEKAITVVRATS